MNLSLLILLSIINFQVEGDTLLQAQILFRHGARNQIYKNWNYEQYKDVLHHLTGVGMRQQYLLGQWLRSRYIENADPIFNILNPILDVNQIYARSTDIPRTIQSALSNLYGLYPPGTGEILPKNVSETFFYPPNTNILNPQIGLNATPYLYTPVPIHTVPANLDIELRSYGVEACPKQDDIYFQNMNSPMMQDLERRSSDLFIQYGKEMQMTEEEIAKINIESLMEDQDTLIVYETNGYQFPKELSQNTKDRMKELYTVKFNIALVSNWEQVRLTSTPFFQNLIKMMDNMLDGNTKSYKFFMYSAHDTTLQLILNGLQFTSAECLYQIWKKTEVTAKTCISEFSTYASNLLFELWKDNNNNPYAMILHNGTYYNPCINIDSLKCPLDIFKKQLEELYTDYITGCEVKTNKVQIKTQNWVWIVIAALSLLLVGSVSCLIVIYTQSKKRMAIYNSLD